MRTIPLITIFFLVNVVWMKWIENSSTRSYGRFLNSISPDGNGLPYYTPNLDSLRWIILANCAAALVCLLVMWRTKAFSRWITGGLGLLWLACFGFALLVG